jgi:hypothetical protein
MDHPMLLRSNLALLQLELELLQTPALDLQQPLQYVQPFHR